MTAGGLKRRQGVVDAERLLVRQPEDPWPEDPWEVRERLLVYQPEDPWEVRERLFRCFRGVSVTAGGLKRG